MNLLSKFKVILFLIALSLFCNEGAFARSEWRFLIYMQADNNLYDYAIWDLLEMQSVEDPTNLEIIVRLDSPGDSGITDLKINFAQLALLNSLEQVKELTLNDLLLEELAHFNETHFESQKASLDDFIFRYGELQSQTALFIWGHGEGFSSDRNAQFGGVAIDDFPHQRLSISELQDSLKLYEDMYVDKVSLLAMDACLMQTLETSIEIQEQTEYFIGSTQIQNFKGLPYHKILEYLGTNEQVSAYDLSKVIPDFFIQSANEDNNASATMSSVNTFELMNVFVSDFNKSFELVNSYIEQNPFEKIAIKEIINNSPFFLGNSRDLATSLRLLEEYFYIKGEKEISRALNSSNASLSRSIINYTYGENYFQENSEYFRGFFKAFAIWFPASSIEYKSKIADFKASKVYKSQKLSSWFQFLDTLHKQSFISF